MSLVHVAASSMEQTVAQQRLIALDLALQQVRAERAAMQREQPCLDTQSHRDSPPPRSLNQQQQNQELSVEAVAAGDQRQLQGQGQQGFNLEGWPQWLKDWQNGAVPHEQAQQLQQEVWRDDQEVITDDMDGEEQHDRQQAAGEAQQESNGGASPGVLHQLQQAPPGTYQLQGTFFDAPASSAAVAPQRNPQQLEQGEALMQVLLQMTRIPGGAGLGKESTTAPAQQLSSLALPPLLSCTQQAAPPTMLPGLYLHGTADGLYKAYPQAAPGLDKLSSGSGNGESEEMEGGEDEGEEQGGSGTNGSGSGSDGSSIAGCSTRRSSRRGRGRRKPGVRGGEAWEQQGKVEGGVAKAAGIQRQRPAGGTSKRKGVTKHRHTLRWEAHLWDNSAPRTHVVGKKGRTRGKQVYLGGFASEDEAARAYDRAAIVYYGTSTQLNGSISDYEHELDLLLSLSKEQVVAMLRRSSGFSRGYASRPCVELLHAPETSSPSDRNPSTRPGRPRNDLGLRL